MSLRRTTRREAWLLAVAVVGALLALALTGARIDNGRAGGAQAIFGGTSDTHTAARQISIFPGIPAISLRGDGLYDADDPWVDYLAPEATCPGAERRGLPLAEQADTMVCLINFARRTRGLEPVTPIELLNDTSVLKAEEIQRCDDFNHDACGVDAATDTRAAGYTGAWGENLFIAEGAWGAPRPSLDGWLNSPDHRENLFHPDWSTAGVAVLKMDRFGDESNVTLWVSQFGTG